MSYLVILYHQNGKPVPLLNDDQWTAELFTTEEDAELAAIGTAFGEQFGYEIIPWDKDK